LKILDRICRAKLDHTKLVPSALLLVATALVLFLLVHGQVTIIFVVSVICLFVCLCSFSQPCLIRFRSNLETCYMSGS